MYGTFLTIHGILRWVVLLAAIHLIYRCIKGMSNGTYNELDRKAGSWFIISLDTQLLLGLILYVFLSPITQAAFQNFGAAMKNKDLRFWAVEHIFGMVLGLILVHIGWASSKKIEDAVVRHKTLLIYVGFAVAIIAFTIPWISRPLIRLGM